jgi:hypothetical protein
MRLNASLLFFVMAASMQAAFAQIPADDAVRIREFYRLKPQIEDQIWPSWSRVPAPLLLVTADREFLTHHPSPPKDFKPAGDDFYERARQFPTALQATFPAFGPPSVIVIGEPKNTASKTSTMWLITLMHEHFHQLQNAQPEYFRTVEELGLSGGDSSGMWMLNYPFPYDKAEVARSFATLRDHLLAAINEPNPQKFAGLAKKYAAARKSFFAQLSSNDKKYLDFQLWQEGIARYTQIKSAEAAAQYHTSAEYAGLADFETFSDCASRARSDTLAELKSADLAQWKRTVVYSLGAAEGLLLDRLHPEWKDSYFKHLLSMDSFFDH